MNCWYSFQYEEDGYALIEDFLTSSEVEEMKNEMHRIIDEMNPKEHPHSVFVTYDPNAVGGCESIIHF
jgi:hypothetical protein